MDHTESRNACPYCAMSEEQRSDARFGEVREWVGAAWTHCTTCHSRRHNACACCGACLEDYEGAWDDKRVAYRKRYRIDKSFCSNACRQKSYRQRRGASRRLAADAES